MDDTQALHWTLLHQRSTGDIFLVDNPETVTKAWGPLTGDEVEMYTSSPVPIAESPDVAAGEVIDVAFIQRDKADFAPLERAAVAGGGSTGSP